MKTKICTQCHKEKPVTEFHKNGNRLRTNCKDCQNSYNRFNYTKNVSFSIKPIKIKKSKEEILQYQKEWREKNKKRLKILAKQRYLRNQKIILEKKHRYYLENKEFLKKQKRDYRVSLTKEQKLKSYEYQKKYRSKNKQNILTRTRKYQREQLKNNIQFRLRLNLRRRILAALDENWKSGHTLELLGCSVEFLKQHLESQFQEGMSWDNYGLKGWHIDHIKPCARFDLTDPKQQEQCFHYTNLQPLWWIDNIRKSDKI